MSPVDHMGGDIPANQASDEARNVDVLGQRAGEIVHDFNNLFQGIVGALDILRTQIAQGRLAEAELMIEQTARAVRSAAVSTRRLLGFVAREATVDGLVDVNAAVAGLEPLIKGATAAAISVAFDLGAPLAGVVCDRNGLENALLNLVINARDAMPDGGGLTVSTCGVRLDEAGAREAGGDAAGDYVCLAVRDTGAGMTPEVRARAFEAYFTTKAAGKGTGLGLSMIAGFVRQAGGWAHIDGAPGAGATVRLYLPAAFAASATDAVPIAAVGSASPGPPAPMVRGETILVVEDEMVVRSLIAEVLREQGYGVIEAADGPEGLAVLIGASRLDLVISDIGLPGLGGREMTEVARAQRPGLKVLLITGHANPPTVLLGPGTALITKPFAMDALTSRVSEMLATD